MWSPNVGKYSACGPGTKHKARIEKFKQTGDVSVLYKNPLDSACFVHDSAYSEHKNVPERHVADEALMQSSLKIAQNESLDAYQRALAAAIYKFFDHKIQLGQGLTRANRVKLKNTYYNPTTGFTSAKKLAERTKIPVKDVQSWLTEQEVYTKHKKYTAKHKTRRVMVRYKDAQWQADLVDMRALAPVNDKNQLHSDRYRFVFQICVECSHQTKDW